MAGEKIIFGGAGFIGSNLVSLLNEKGESPVVFDNLSMGNQLESGSSVTLTIGDMNDVAVITDLLKSVKPSIVYHLVANSDIAATSVNPLLDLDNTLGTTASLIAGLRMSGIKTAVVFASSSAVYAPSEEELSESSVTVPVSSYGWMKLASERLLENAVLQGVIPKLFIARFPNVTGANQTHGVVHDLAKRLAENHKELDVLGDGHQEKPYILASELVQTLEKVICQNWHGAFTANIGPSSTITVREIVSLLISESGLSPNVVYGDTPFGWVGDVPKYKINTRLIREKFALPAFSSSESAMRSSVAWAWNHFS